MQYLTLVKTTKEGRTDALGIMFISGSLEVLNNTIKSWELLDAREEADRLGLPVPDYQDEDGDDDTKRDLDELLSLLGWSYSFEERKTTECIGEMIC